MTSRLLSLLTLVESALAQQSALPEAYRSARIVNFEKGLARLTLFGADGATPCGVFHVQSYVLANGEPCVKVIISWQDSSETTSVPIFPKAGCDWSVEATKLANIWLGGAPVPMRVSSPQFSKTQQLAVAS